METTTYTIPNWNIKGVLERLEKLARRANKLGSTEICVQTVGYKDVTVTEDGEERVIPCTLVEVSGKAPKIAEDWTLVGVANYTTIPGEIFFKMVPGENLSDHARSVAESRVCEHCQAVRGRNDTFIIRNINGQEMLVGRQCIADFLGHVSPQHIASLGEILFELSRPPRVDMDFARARPVVSIIDFLAATSLVVEADRHYDGARTPYLAWDIVRLFRNNETPFANKEAVFALVNGLSVEYYERAFKVLRWLSTKTDAAGQTYFENAQKVARTGHVVNQTARLIASLSVVYAKEMNEIREREQGLESEFVGTIKKRECFGDVTVKNIIEIEGQWGTTFLMKMVRDDGAQLVWFSSNKPRYEAEAECRYDAPKVEVGDRIHVNKATVKAHELRDGVKQTVLTRVVFGRAN